MPLVFALLGALRAALGARSDLVLENLALRQQLALLRRRAKRPRFGQLDRLFWMWLSQRWARWRKALNVVQPQTVILASLPHVLGAGEIIEGLSLGAGNTGRHHDLETDRQIAEFKFISWRGQDTIRQNSTFVDLFNLASAETEKRKVLYLLDKAHPLKFFQGGRALLSVLSSNARAAKRFKDRHGDTFARVRDYYGTIKDSVEIVDLRDVVPLFKSVTLVDEERAIAKGELI